MLSARYNSINMKMIVRSIFFIPLLLSTNLILYGQTGCKYNGDFNTILSEVKARNNNAPTEEDKLTDVEARKVAKYWELDCKCRRGVSTQQEAQALANEAFLNTSNNFYKGYGVNKKKKELGYLGDLKTPFAVFTPGSCVGNDSSFGSDVESLVNCTPEASRIKRLDGQLGAYASTFFMAYCKCKTGVSSQEEADVLIAQMKTNHQNFNNMRNSATPPLSTQPLTSCSIGSGNGSSIGGGGGQTNKLINDDWMALLNNLAATSDNEIFNNMVGTMNEVKGKVAEMQDYANMIVPGLGNPNFFNTMENTGNAIAMVGAGIDLISSIFEKKEPQYTESQIEAYNTYDKISSGLLVIYDEVASVPTFYEFDRITLDKVETREQLLEEYDLNTAKQRLLCLEYLLYNSHALPDNEWLSSRSDEIDGLSDEGAVNEIKTLAAKYKESYSLPLHLYSELGFIGAKNKINKYKETYYEKSGNKAEAEKYKSRINHNVSYQDAVKLTFSSFREENYLETAEYGQLLFDLFRDEENVALMYDDLPGLKGIPIIYRSDLAKLMAMTVISDVKNNKMTRAKMDLEELIQFHERLKNMKLNKNDVLNINMKAEQLPVSEAMMLASKSYVHAAENKHNEALSEINQAIELYKGKDVLNHREYADWLNYLKLEVLLAKGDYQEAEVFLKELRAQSQYLLNTRIYPASKLNYINAYIRYEKGDYNGALIALNILEKQTPDLPKIYGLKEKVYLKLSNAEKAKESRNKYIELTTKK